MSTIFTFNSQLVDLLHPDPATISIRDVAHGLSQIHRYNGHTKVPLTVAQHSIACSMAPGLTASERMDMLLHDAAEAYLGDIVRPVKDLISGYEDIEKPLLAAIFQSVNRPFPYDNKLVKEVDLKVRSLEMMEFFPAEIPDKFWDHISEYSPKGYGSARFYYRNLVNNYDPNGWDGGSHTFEERFHELVKRIDVEDLQNAKKVVEEVR